MPSIHAKSKTCFVFSDGEGGFVVKMTMPNEQPLEYELKLPQAATLLERLASAVADMTRPRAAGQPEKYFQK
jgi:hypothetical protein